LTDPFFRHSLLSRHTACPRHDAVNDARVKDGRAMPELGAGMPQGMAEPSPRREQVDVPRE
jgi:hypothetical protein